MPSWQTLQMADGRVETNFLPILWHIFYDKSSILRVLVWTRHYDYGFIKFLHFSIYIGHNKWTMNKYSVIRHSPAMISLLGGLLKEYWQCHGQIDKRLDASYLFLYPDHLGRSLYGLHWTCQVRRAFYSFLPSRLFFRWSNIWEWLTSI